MPEGILAIYKSRGLCLLHPEWDTCGGQLSVGQYKKDRGISGYRGNGAWHPCDQAYLCKPLFSEWRKGGTDRRTAGA